MAMHPNDLGGCKEECKGAKFNILRPGECVFNCLTKNGERRADFDERVRIRQRELFDAGERSKERMGRVLFDIIEEDKAAKEAAEKAAAEGATTGNGGSSPMVDAVEQGMEAYDKLRENGNRTRQNYEHLAKEYAKIENINELIYILLELCQDIEANSNNSDEINKNIEKIDEVKKILNGTEEGRDKLKKLSLPDNLTDVDSVKKFNDRKKMLGVTATLKKSAEDLRNKRIIQSDKDFVAKGKDNYLMQNIINAKVKLIEKINVSDDVNVINDANKKIIELNQKIKDIDHNLKSEVGDLIDKFDTNVEDIKTLKLNAKKIIDNIGPAKENDDHAKSARNERAQMIRGYGYGKCSKMSIIIAWMIFAIIIMIIILIILGFNNSESQMINTSRMCNL